jgi:capsular polysaccharide biosynthesis protein
MELRRYYTIVRRRWIMVILTVALAAVGANLATPRPVLYRSETTVYVGSRIFNVNAGVGASNLSSDLQAGLANIMQTFSVMIPSDPIARDALRLASVPRSPGTVVSETSVKIKAPQLLGVTVTDPDPVIAQKLADAVTNAFLHQVQQLEPVPQEGTLPVLPAYRFQSANLPTAPLPTSAKRNTILGALFGLVVGCCVAFVLEYVDVTVRTPEEAERRSGLPVLGAVPSLRSGLKPAEGLLLAQHQNRVPQALPGA